MSKPRECNMELSPFSSDDWCGDSAGSDEDLITDYIGSSEKQGGPSPLVPTISVTPHSPAGKNYPILEDNLQQLHYIQESIQQMRDLALNSVGCQESSRMSASCPSLPEANGCECDLLSNVTSTPSNTITLNTPNVTRSFHTKRGSGEWELYGRINHENTCEISRRRSWAALEDLANGKGSIKPHIQRRSNLGSVSLSSMESDMDDPFCESTTNLLGPEELKVRVRQARTTTTSSTHSLNEAELQGDFKKIVSKREAENRLLNARLNSPLQKSVSTPSIIAVRELASVEPRVEPSTAPLSVTSDTEQQPEKRRKRGSTFFRKKKDKPKKSTHQWISVCYGNAQTCDLCSKSLTNKPSVYCETCTVTVHLNSCKDNVADCKGKGVKVSKTGSSASNKSSKKGGSPSSQADDDHHHHYNSHHDQVAYSDDVPLVQYEFLDEPLLTDLETDPYLGLQDEEPDSWTPRVSKEVVKKLKEKEIKRQEHIYEFILTEKHHCLTLRVMQKIFVEGLQKYLQFGNAVDKMFPRLNELSDIHMGFLRQLRTRQKQSQVIESIGDILLEEFSGINSDRLKSAYGEFCSNHRNAVDVYKDYMAHDSKFSDFVRHCQGNPLLKKKGIPECILFVTQRLTKYPLLIEPLIKTSKENKEEQDKLVKALSLVKEILVEVDAQVAEKEKEDRKLEIYSKVDPKSLTVHRGRKYDKNSIFSENRKLRFEGVATLMQGRGKMQLVMVLVLSDILCFLLENNQKYTFFTPENKAGIVSLQKLLVREKAGQDSRGIYLISSNPNDPEMFELRIQKPKDKQVWIQSIRTAVQHCSEEEDSRHVYIEDFQKNFDSKQNQIHEIVELLKQKDREQALILEDKMDLQLKLLAASGVENVPERPNYEKLVSEKIDNAKVWKDVLRAVHNVNYLAKSLVVAATNLSRSASSVGEHYSENYISPTLPKRAETFGGFDNPAGIPRLPKKWLNNDSEKYKVPSDPGIEVASGDESGEHDQRLVAAHLSHHVYTLSCIISQQMTTIDSLEAELATLKSHMGESGRPIYRHNQQLEELRNLQDRLQSEKEAWQKEKEAESKELEQKKEELVRLQEQVRVEQADITQQREQLYRKLESLSNQGILVKSTSPALVVATMEETGTPSSILHTPPSDRRKADSAKWKASTKSSTLPLNLISATNEQKASVQIKQQFPYKLATKLGGSSPSNVKSPDSSGQMLPLKLCEGLSDGKKRLSSPPQPPPSHSRTGSSPASMQSVHVEAKTSAKAGRTNTYPKLPDKFRIRSNENRESDDSNQVQDDTNKSSIYLV